MRIENGENFLTIECVPIGDGYNALKFEATARASRFNFTASHERVMIDSGESTIARFTEFESSKANQIEFKLTEEGWLRFSRDMRGYITVGYRFASCRALAAVEGELNVEGEFANEFCREFRKLLNGQNQPVESQTNNSPAKGSV
jgi:hypothetical protein